MRGCAHALAHQPFSDRLSSAAAHIQGVRTRWVGRGCGFRSGRVAHRGQATTIRLRNLKRRVDQGIPGFIHCARWPRCSAAARATLRELVRTYSPWGGRALINAIITPFDAKGNGPSLIHPPRAAVRSGVTMCISRLVIAQRGPRLAPLTSHQRRVCNRVTISALQLQVGRDS